MRKRLGVSPEFKPRPVLVILAVIQSQAEAGRKHGMSESIPATFLFPA